ncbi:unnamed protein product, partial [Didymodactylos carnosus]
MPENPIEIDYNKNVCQIRLITRPMNYSDRMKVENGYQIIIFKETENTFQIYFRDQNHGEILNRLLEEKLVEILPKLEYDQEIVLSKEEDKRTYQMIYEQVQLNHGFTKYSFKQIQSFEKSREMFQEKLTELNKYLLMKFKEVLEKKLTELNEDLLVKFKEVCEEKVTEQDKDLLTEFKEVYEKKLTELNKDVLAKFKEVYEKKLTDLHKDLLMKFKEECEEILTKLKKDLLTKFEEVFEEKLTELNKDLLPKFKEYIDNEIKLILDSQLPEFWSLRLSPILNNLKITLEIEEKFPDDFTLTSLDSIKQSDLTTSDPFEILNKIIENLLSKNKQNAFLDFYRCLSIFDDLLTKIFNGEFEGSINDLSKDLSSKQQSFDPLHYESTMKKILLNLRINHEEFNLEFLSKIEKKVKINEKSLSRKKDYLSWIIERIETEAMNRYNQQLDKYKEKRKQINHLMQEIIDLFWSNISMSDLLNKEREKIYLHLNIEKLLQLSNEDPQSILNGLLTKMKELQTNSNKKQFTNKMHQYLNKEINQQLNSSQYKIVVPIEWTTEIQSKISNILRANYTIENSEMILDELSILFEISISYFEDKSVFDKFCQSYAKLFKYFSWRLHEYQPKSRRQTIDQAIQRFSSSMKKFKMKLDHLSIDKIQRILDARVKEYKEFCQFETFYYLRTHDNQLQQELNYLQSENQVESISADQMRHYWSKKLQQSMFKDDNQSITKLANEIFQTINEKIFTEKVQFDKETESTHANDASLIEEQLPELRKEDKAKIKINLEDQIRALKHISEDVIRQEEKWENRIKLIQYFEKIKTKLIEDYFKSIYEQQSDKSTDYQTFRNSTNTKNVEEILTETDVDEWNRQIDDFKVYQFTIDLLKIYELNVDVLQQQYDFIEKSMGEQQDDESIKNKWSTEVKENEDLMNIVEFIQKYSTKTSHIGDYQTSLEHLTIQFINDIKAIHDIKSSVDALHFFNGFERFEKMAEIFKRKFFSSSKSKKIPLHKVSDFFYLISNVNDFQLALDLIENSKIDNWLLYLNVMKIQFDLNSLFHRYLDELDLNHLIVENLDHLDESIEIKYNEIAKQYQTSLNTISNTIKSIELNPNLKPNEKEMFFEFLRIQFSLELKKPANNLIHPNDLEKFFNKYLIKFKILKKVISSLNNTSMDFNDQLIIGQIRLKSLNNLLRYLTRFWIIEQLELDRKVRENEVIQIIQYLELIETSYSEEKMRLLIGLVQMTCKDESIIPQIVIDLLMNISNNEWDFDLKISQIMETTEMSEWEKKIEHYMKEKRSKMRDLKELIHLMRQDKNNLNQSIKDYLNSPKILEDLESLFKKLNHHLDDDIKKPVRDWDNTDIARWATKMKGNQLLSNKESVQNAILIVSQGIHLFTGKKFRLRETQIIALWLYLNPDLNKTNVGCLGQISTGE